MLSHKIANAVCAVRGVLRYRVLRYAVLCYLMPCHAILCHAMPRLAMLLYAAPCYDMLCYDVLGCAILYCSALGEEVRNQKSLECQVLGLILTLSNIVYMLPSCSMTFVHFGRAGAPPVKIKTCYATWHRCRVIVSGMISCNVI